MDIIGGKTGTAQQPKEENVQNQNKYFCIYFPSSQPKFVLVVMLESPKGSPSYVYNYKIKKVVLKIPFNTAGWTSIEVTGQILDEIAYFSHKAFMLIEMHLAFISNLKRISKCIFLNELNAQK